MLLATLLPARCGVCERTGASPCTRCIADLHPGPPVRAPAPLTSVAALLRYDPAAARLVVGVKRRHERSAVPWLASGMALLLPSDAEVVTWAPTVAARAARRGFDHAELLARTVARVAGRPCHRTLRRHGGAQQGRDRVERLAGPSFTAVVDLGGRSVVLVDDVTTTGSTLARAAEALVLGGAGPIHACVAAAVV